MRELTDLRAADPAYAGLNAQSAQVTLQRLHLAFAGSFRRVKTADTPGFPRFKSFDRFSGWGYKTHRDGFTFTSGDGNKHGKLRLAGIGSVRVRGRARTLGEVKTCEIQHKGERWYASLTISCKPQRAKGTRWTGVDRIGEERLDTPDRGATSLRRQVSTAKFFPRLRVRFSR
jgi:putative transposase